MPRYLLGPLLALSVWNVAMLSSHAATAMQIGENWLGGQPVQQDLVAYGGTIYREYSQSPTQDGEPNRIRLIRYPQVVTQAAVAAMSTRSLYWELGNELNNADQDGGLTTDAAATAYTTWFHNTVANIKAADPTAKILGPSVLGWTLYCCEPYLTTGQRAYQRFVASYQQQYGTIPRIDALAFHYYPATTYDLAQSESELAQQLGMAVDYAHSQGWGVVVTEWGHWATYGEGTCYSTGQTEQARYNYTLRGLQAMSNKGVLMVLYFANIPSGCNNNGHASWLYDGNVLTVEGLAHRDFMQLSPVVTPTMIFIPTASYTVVPPILTPTPTTTYRPVVTPTATVATPTKSPTYSPTVCGTVISRCTATPTLRPCVPTFIRRCP